MEYWRDKELTTVNWEGHKVRFECYETAMWFAYELCALGVEPSVCGPINRPLDFVHSTFLGGGYD